MVDYVHSTFQYYSKWDNFKELFVIPYKKGHFKSTGRLFPSKTSKLVKTSKIESTKTQKTSSNAGGASTLATATSGTVKASSGTPINPEKKTHSKPPKKTPEQPTNKAKEDENELYQQVYFTRSKTPRAVRPSHVKLKVGQVVEHKQDGYIGVIVGWDEVAKVSMYV